jgi:phosphatidylserine/phosphatidylglycerophosphate/cardiolipin synthase-like enzyme
VVADDVVSFGTVNLDAWALYRNSEIMMLARSAGGRGADAGAADRARHRALAAGRVAAGTHERFQAWVWEKLAFVL